MDDFTKIKESDLFIDSFYKILIRYFRIVFKFDLTKECPIYVKNKIRKYLSNINTVDEFIGTNEEDEDYDDFLNLLEYIQDKESI